MASSSDLHENCFLSACDKLQELHLELQKKCTNLSAENAVLKDQINILKAGNPDGEPDTNQSPPLFSDEEESASIQESPPVFFSDEESDEITCGQKSASTQESPPVFISDEESDDITRGQKSD